MEFAENIIINKSFNFAKRIVNLNKFLNKEKKEYILSKQILKSGTSIGANVFEAQNAQSNADFLSKMKIALKEATETLYWLMLLHETEYINDSAFSDLKADLDDIRNILGSICKTTEANA
jgi:four helix bundle protein